MSLSTQIVSDDECSSDDEEMLIDNPFFKNKQYLINDKYGHNFDFNLKDIYVNFNRVLILCLQNKKNINKEFYHSELSLSKIKE